MIENRPEPDFGLCYAVLDRQERAVVEGWLCELGAPAGTWPAIPPLRVLISTLAVARLAADMDLSRGDALRAAAEAVGVEDDDRRATHPGDRFRRTLHNWIAAARGTDGKVFPPPEEGAA